MKRKIIILIVAVTAFTGGFALGWNNDKPCKTYWSENTNTPGACAER